MANTVISLRSSGVTGNTPSLGVLANGELSLNFADGILYYKSAANTLGSIRTTQPTGLNQEIQFNDSGSFGANSAFTFNKTIATLNVTNINTSSLVTGGGVGGIIAGANVIYSNVFVANSGGYVQFSDGSKQYTANAGGTFAQAAYTHANGAFDKANTDTTNISATAGVYGNATHVPVITLAANGRVSSIVNTAISGAGGGGGNSFGVIYTSNNSTYANASVSTDQLNFVGEAGVIAFANSLTKTITIAGTPGAQGLTVDYGYVYEAMNYSIDYGTL
jgi:hypothetical protein